MMDSTSAVAIEAILPLLEGEAIFETDFNVLLQILSKESTISQCSKADLNHLGSRACNYLKSNNTRYRWIGSKLAVVLCLHPSILVSTHCLNFINALIKVLETKCFIQNETNPDIQSLITLESCVKSLEFIIDNIRGKPTLTREILTPKLSSIIGSLIDLIPIIPRISIDLLYQLLLKNSTTFRPFGAKFEKALMQMIGDDERFLKLDKSLQDKICSSLCLLSFSLSRNNIPDIWRQKVMDLILETKSVITIYSEFLDFTNDSDFQTSLSKIPARNNADDQPNTLFPGLSIDVNERSFDIMKIHRRLNVLVRLLIQYLVTPTANTQVKIPLGYYLVVSDLLTGLNIKFMPIKRDIRDPELLSLIGYSVKSINQLGLQLLNVLPIVFKGDLLPHVSLILATLDSLIPVKRINGKITVDEDKVFEDREIFTYLISTATKYLKMVKLYNDMSVLSKTVEVALILTNTKNNLKSANPSTAAGKSGNNSKNNKNGSNNISIADVLSHQHLFVSKPNSKTIRLLRKFFIQLLNSVQLPSSKITDIQRFLILDCFTNMNILNDGIETSENKELLELLHAALLFPGSSNNTISILPILSTLIGESILMSVLSNPRLPVLPKRVIESLSYSEPSTSRNFAQQEEDNEEDDEAEDEAVDDSAPVAQAGTVVVEEEAIVTKKRKVEEDKAVENMIFKKAAINPPSTIPTATITATHFKEEEQVENVIPDAAPAVRDEFADKAQAEDDEEDNDDDSDFEIPEIDAEDDDDEE